MLTSLRLKRDLLLALAQQKQLDPVREVNFRLNAISNLASNARVFDQRVAGTEAVVTGRKPAA